MNSQIGSLNPLGGGVGVNPLNPLSQSSQHWQNPLAGGTASGMGMGEFGGGNGIGSMFGDAQGGRDVISNKDLSVARK